MAGEAGHVRLERPIDSSSDKSVCAPKVAEKGPYTGGLQRRLDQKAPDRSRFLFLSSTRSGITTYRNGPKRTGTDRNGPKRTGTDRNGLSWIPKRTFWVPKRTLVNTETDRDGPERTEMDRNGLSWIPKRTFWIPKRTFWVPKQTFWVPKRTLVDTERSNWSNWSIKSGSWTFVPTERGGHFPPQGMYKGGHLPPLKKSKGGHLRPHHF